VRINDSGHRNKTISIDFPDARLSDTSDRYDPASIDSDVCAPSRETRSIHHERSANDTFEHDVDSPLAKCRT
jgi:hypothetical protein